MKKENISLMVGLIMVAVSFVALAFIFNRLMSEQKQIGIKLHPYDYIVHCDYTDSTMEYTIFDDKHRIVSTCTSKTIDSAIIRDNL